MLVFLVRHGEAKSSDEDPARPLSEKGLKDVGKVAAYFSCLNIGVDEILHSGKQRARQTAEIIALHSERSERVSEIDGLAPNDDPALWYRRLLERKDNVMLVGHLPHLKRLASLLLFHNEQTEFFCFEPGEIICLERGDRDKWSLRWMMPPEIV